MDKLSVDEMTDEMKETLSIIKRSVETFISNPFVEYSQLQHLYDRWFEIGGTFYEYTSILLYAIEIYNTDGIDRIFPTFTNVVNVLDSLYEVNHEESKICAYSIFIEVLRQKLIPYNCTEGAQTLDLYENFVRAYEFYKANKNRKKIELYISKFINKYSQTESKIYKLPYINTFNYTDTLLCLLSRDEVLSGGDPDCLAKILHKSNALLSFMLRLSQLQFCQLPKIKKLSEEQREELIIHLFKAKEVNDDRYIKDSCSKESNIQIVYPTSYQICFLYRLGFFDIFTMPKQTVPFLCTLLGCKDERQITANLNLLNNRERKPKSEKYQCYSKDLRKFVDDDLKQLGVISDY